MGATILPNVFFSYCHADEALRDQLEKQLSMLKRQGVIETWHDRRIGAGQEIDAAIDDHINSDEIILLLVSPDFIASDYCYNIEMTRAMERHGAGEAIVIPVILGLAIGTTRRSANCLAHPRTVSPSHFGRIETGHFCKLRRRFVRPLSDAAVTDRVLLPRPSATTSLAVQRPPLWPLLALGLATFGWPRRIPSWTRIASCSTASSTSLAISRTHWRSFNHATLGTKECSVAWMQIASLRVSIRTVTTLRR